MLLWVLTVIGLYNIKDINNNLVFDFYECGFRGTTNSTLVFKFNSIISGLFILLYEIEIFLVIPTLFNFDILGTNLWILFILFFFITITIYLDLYYCTIK